MLHQQMKRGEGGSCEGETRAHPASAGAMFMSWLAMVENAPSSNPCCDVEGLRAQGLPALPILLISQPARVHEQATHFSLLTKNKQEKSDKNILL
jgi:hypothetical protein